MYDSMQEELPPEQRSPLDSLFLIRGTAYYCAGLKIVRTRAGGDEMPLADIVVRFAVMRDSAEVTRHGAGVLTL